MKKIIFGLDWILLLSVLLLVTLSVFMIFSASVGEIGGFDFVIRQIVYCLVGLVVGGLVIAFGYRFFLHFSPFLYFSTIAVLIITFILGLETRGSTRWIDFGVFTLQGSELAKPVLILALAGLFVKFPPVKFRNLLLSIFVAAVPTLLVFVQPDLGSAVILGLIWVGLVYLAGIKLRYFFLLFASFAVILPVGFNFLRGYQKERLLTFLNPTADPLGAGYNLVQSIIAVGSGQFLGRGFGRGPQSHLNFLPEQKTDFIFATTAEELGFLGVALILILFSILLWRLLVIGQRTSDKAGSLICYGAALIIASQLFINAGMNMGLLPITGITLPFISFGGSSLLSLFILLGLVQSVHLQSRERYLI